MGKNPLLEGTGRTLYPGLPRGSRSRLVHPGKFFRAPSAQERVLAPRRGLTSLGRSGGNPAGLPHKKIRNRGEPETKGTPVRCASLNQGYRLCCGGIRSKHRNESFGRRPGYGPVLGTVPPPETEVSFSAGRASEMKPGLREKESVPGTDGRPLTDLRATRRKQQRTSAARADPGSVPREGTEFGTFGREMRIS